VHHALTAIARWLLHVADDHDVVYTMYSMFIQVVWCSHHAHGAMLWSNIPP